jgi:hypothetical protein
LYSISLIVFVTAKIKTEIKGEVKPKLFEKEEKAGEIKSKVMFGIDLVSLSLLVSPWTHS